MRSRVNTVMAVVLLVLTVAACGKKKPPLPSPPAEAEPPAVTESSGRPQPVEEAVPVPPEPIAEDKIGGRSLDELNRDSPFRPVFFSLDSAELDNDGRAIATTNAEMMKKYSSWVITIEGHCDERGTAEYNLALGERRAVAVRTYLVSLGIAPDRLRTVSYGKEFPFDPAHSETAWSKNRRAHFVITSK